MAKADCVGTVWFILNIIFYLINLTMTATRAIKHPKVFKQSFYDRAEGVWFPTSIIAMATLLIGTILLGIPFCGVSLPFALGDGADDSNG